MPAPALPAPDPSDLALFARLIEHGSFSRAAERCGLPKATVSRRIAALEAQLGERLVVRTTRRLALTEFGEAMLAHARRVAEEADAAASLAAHRQAQPSGRLRVSMPNDFASTLLAPMLVEFARACPQVTLELDLSPRRVDLIGEGFDLAIRMGTLPDDATLVARRVAEMPIGLFASRSYLAERGMPAHPADLAGHVCLRLLNQRGEPTPWELIGPEGATWRSTGGGPLCANSVGMLARLAEEGAGIAALARPYVKAAGAPDALLPLLPDWRLAPVTAWAVLPGRRLLPAKTRVFLERLSAALGG